MAYYWLKIYFCISLSQIWIKLNSIFFNYINRYDTRDSLADYISIHLQEIRHILARGCWEIEWKKKNAPCNKSPLEEVTYEERCWLPFAQQLLLVWWMERDRKTKAGRHFRKHALCTGHRAHPGKEVNITKMINCIPTKVSFPKHMLQAQLISWF